jgi:hypothetical protein
MTCGRLSGELTQTAEQFSERRSGSVARLLRIHPDTPRGDDFSFVITDKRFVLIGWGDSNGSVQLWYGRIPISSAPSPGSS